MVRQFWPRYQQLAPATCQIIRAAINQSAPALETQIYNIVVASGN